MGGARSWEASYYVITAEDYQMGGHTPERCAPAPRGRVMTAADLGCAERTDGTLVVLLHRAMIAADIMGEGPTSSRFGKTRDGVPVDGESHYLPQYDKEFGKYGDPRSIDEERQAAWSKRWSPWTYSRRHLPPSGF